MTYHLLALGGDRANEGNFRDLYPQGGIHKEFPLEVDIRKSHVRHSITSHLNPDQKGCGSSGLQIGNPGQGTYFMQCPVKVGDVIAMTLLPMFSSLHGVWWILRNPVPGLTVNIGLAGCAQSLNPNNEPRPPEEIGVMLLEGLDLGQPVPMEGTECTPPSGYICVQDTGNKPGRYLNQNDMLLIEIVTLPEEEDFKCLDFCVSPVVDTYCKGDMAAMSKMDTLSYGPNTKTRIV